jgi:predicted amidohydrolase
VLEDAREARRLAGVDLLLLPELLDGGYAALKAGAPPHRVQDRFVGSIRSASSRYRFCCVAGTMMLEDHLGRRTNTALVFRSGQLVHRYDKIHLFRPTSDHRYFSPGRTIGTFTLHHDRHRLRAGVAVCYDLRFPELIRAMALDGMQVLCVPARWPRARDEAWRTMLKARAIENQVFVLGCNARGAEGGKSYAFDPTGKLLYASRGNGGPALDIFTIDLRRLDTARLSHRNLREAVFLHESRLPHRLTLRRGVR